jgi:hypothetical protein
MCQCPPFAVQSAQFGSARCRSVQWVPICERHFTGQVIPTYNKFCFVVLGFAIWKHIESKNPHCEQDLCFWLYVPGTAICSSSACMAARNFTSRGDLVAPCIVHVSETFCGK